MCLNQERQNVVIYGENILFIVLWLSPISVSEWDILVYFLYMILFWAQFCICLHKNGIISEYFGLFAVYDTVLSLFLWCLFKVQNSIWMVYFWYISSILYCIKWVLCIFLYVFTRKMNRTYWPVQFGSVRPGPGRVSHAFYFYFCYYFMIIVMSNYIYILLHY